MRSFIYLGIVITVLSVFSASVYAFSNDGYIGGKEYQDEVNDKVMSDCMHLTDVEFSSCVESKL